MLQEFKKFIMRGNVIDIAVGLIIAVAFNKIVTSLVDDIITPPLGFILNKVDFKDLKIGIGESLGKPVTINYGLFLQSIVQFFIVAFVIFLIVKGINSLKKKEETAPSITPPTGEEKLLMEIRDLLKK